MVARYVMPRFQGLNTNRDESLHWARDNRDSFTAQSMGAVGAAIIQHIQEKGTENISPLILRQMGMAPPKKKEAS